MTIADLPIFSMLRSRMQWHQERQRLLAENIANADTPNFQPRDLAPLRFDREESAGIALASTSPGHIAAAAPRGFALRSGQPFEVRPAGNAVQLEDEMLKVAANQIDYQAATTLYSRSLGLIKLALARK